MMADSPQNDPVTVRVEVTFPSGHVVRQIGAKFTRDITHPTQTGTTTAKQITETHWKICAYGTGAGDSRHIFGRVYNTDPGTVTEPPNDPLTMWTYPTGVGNDGWSFGFGNDILLPVEGAVPGTKTLIIWFDDGTDYTPVKTTFNVVAGTYTYCSQMILESSPLLTQRRDWSRMANTWSFQLQGCTNLICSNCGQLNGTWILERETSTARQDLWCWLCKLDFSFFSRDQSSIWRLMFNPNDGFWYLDCVSGPEQTLGSWISYRLHESAWNPEGPNVLLLNTNSGYCEVPPMLTLQPYQK